MPAPGLAPAARAALALALAQALAGCTLLQDEQAFQVDVRSDLREEWTGTLQVRDVDGGGDPVFARTVTVTANSIRTQYHLPELDGTYAFSVRSAGLLWEHEAAMVPGDSAWNVLVHAPDRVCFELVRDGEREAVCPVPRPS